MICGAEEITDYASSLDACREFEEALSDEEKLSYIELLCQGEWALTNREMWRDFWMVATATPRQRCIAFLKVKGVLK